MRRLLAGMVVAGAVAMGGEAQAALVYIVNTQAIECEAACISIEVVGQIAIRPGQVDSADDFLDWNLTVAVTGGQFDGKTTVIDSSNSELELNSEAGLGFSAVAGERLQIPQGSFSFRKSDGVVAASYGKNRFSEEARYGEFAADFGVRAGQFAGELVATPLPAALPLLGAAVGGLALTRLRREQGSR